MGKITTGFLVLIFVVISAAAFAHPWGASENTGLTVEQQKFFAETKDLRKEMHDKRFELMEAYRAQVPDAEKISALEKEIDSLREKMQSRAQEVGISSGCGNCGNRGRNGCGMMQGRI